MKVKPILVIVITLIIGFVLGMLTSAQIRYNKLKPVRLYFITVNLPTPRSFGLS